MLKKYYTGEAVGLSSSPLSSLMPWTSLQKQPDYSNALLFTLGLNNSLQLNNTLLLNLPQLLFGALSMKDYSLEFQDWSSPISNLILFRAGLATLDSSNPLIALNGLAMLDDSISLLNLDVSNSLTPTPSVDYLSAGFDAMKTIGNKIGGKAGLVISSLGGLASSIKKARDAGKGLKDGIKGAGISKAGSVGAAIGAASDLLSAFMPLKSEYDGPKGDITLTMDSIYDGISDAAMALGPAGMLVGGIMKGGALLGKGMNALGGGTSGMTKTDAILGSSFLSLTPIGLINGFGGSKANTITRDTAALDTVGSSYTGSLYTIEDALSKSGKKYGLFSLDAKNKANDLISNARAQQYTISNIADEANKRFAIQNAMSAINGNRYGLKLQGGYNLSSVRLGKSGLKIENIDKAKSLLDKYRNLQTNLLQLGGSIDPFDHYLETLPENLRDSTNFRVKDYWIFNGKPKDFKEAIKIGMFTKEKDGWHAHTIAWNPETGEGEFMKSPDHPSILLEIDWYNSDNGSEFRSEYELVKSSPYWKYVKRIQKEVPSHKEGGSFITISAEETSIELVNPEDSVEETPIEIIDPLSMPEFKEGGSINVIPDGALHARKHNMDLEGITKKGIPVVSETEDGRLELQAEIEKEEIIFRLEVTLKLEELEKKFYSEDSTLELKDEYALEAGKLLVNEILHNTLDNTNKLL